MASPTHKVTACRFSRTKDGKIEKGLYILNIKANTVVILDKNLNKVPCPWFNCVTQELHEGNIYFNLSNRK